MERLLGWKFWAFTITGYIFSTITVGHELYDWLKATFGINHLFAFETAASAVFGAIFFILYLKPVWRWIWRLPIIGPWLSQIIFPDLNGEWDVKTMLSNWSRIEAMRDTAKDANRAPYDADNNYSAIQLKPVTTFKKAVIDQRWPSITMTLYPDPDHPCNNDEKAEESVTIAFDLVRDKARRQAISYLYLQKNKAENLAESDVEEFMGAAMLTVKDDKDQLTLNGHYFTMRSWQQGFNTAGKLTLTKRK